MIHTGKLCRAELLNKNAWPYTNVNEVYAANKGKYPGKKLVVVNGHWCTGVAPVAWYRISGVWLATEASYRSYGLTWSGNERPRWAANDGDVGENFVSTIPVLEKGAVIDYSWQQPGVKRKCNRTWWGWLSNGECSVEVTTEGYTLDGIVERMQSLGVVDGMVLDGSGSSQWADGETWLKGSDGRRVYEFLLLWFDVEDTPEKTEDKMSNSSLVDYTRLSPHNRARTAPITKITIHHMACVATVEQCGAGFCTDRVASSNYGIDSDGRVGLYVDESRRALTSSNTANDNAAVTIEVSNSKAGGNWPISDKAYMKLLDLCEDVCRRNGIGKLVFTGDPTGNLTYHSMFAATACPGPYLKALFPTIAAEVNRRLGVPGTLADTAPEPEPEPEPVEAEKPAATTIYRVMEVVQGQQLAAFSAEKYAEAYRKKLADAGRNVYVVRVERSL